MPNLTSDLTATGPRVIAQVSAAPTVAMINKKPNINVAATLLLSQPTIVITGCSKWRILVAVAMLRSIESGDHSLSIVVNYNRHIIVALNDSVRRCSSKS